uniref:Crystallin zeta like 1 n=1 Tax=Malurus cyaneus samueli TaxID=2593467 RepID=A0A8C5T5Y3_9PASS
MEFFSFCLFCVCILCLPCVVWFSCTSFFPFVLFGTSTFLHVLPLLLSVPLLVPLQTMHSGTGVAEERGCGVAALCLRSLLHGPWPAVEWEHSECGMSLDIIRQKKQLPVPKTLGGVSILPQSENAVETPLELRRILPLDSEESGVCEIILVHEHYLVHKPEKVCWAEAAGTVRDGLRAYTALHYLSQVSPGTAVLVLDGASPFGTIAIQLAQHRGAKVISTAHSLEDKQYLERLRPSVARVIDVSHGKIDVAESCLEETGGLGVDIVLDAGVRLYSAEDEPTSKSQLLPHKHDIITLLGVGGRWITMEKNLQLDPPDSHSLFLKGATVSFLNDEIWNLSNVQQGKYLDILWWFLIDWYCTSAGCTIFNIEILNIFILK